MRPWRWALIHQDWCTYKTAGDTSDASARTKGRMRTQGEGGHLQAKERGLMRNQSCPDLNPRLPGPRTVRK